MLFFNTIGPPPFQGEGLGVGWRRRGVKEPFPTSLRSNQKRKLVNAKEKHRTMSNDDRLILDYMMLLRHLSLDLKLKLIARLTESVRNDVAASVEGKDDSWKSLSGVWSDTKDDMADFIKSNRA
jgi:hypothetical protein